MEPRTTVEHDRNIRGARLQRWSTTGLRSTTGIYVAPRTTVEHDRNIRGAPYNGGVRQDTEDIRGAPYNGGVCGRIYVGLHEHGRIYMEPRTTGWSALRAKPFGRTLCVAL